ncbi:histidine kinase dimerization/phosphoacceptor domain -containing protein [Variovorax sp. ZT4R33]|uniref:GAF domain-containing protein n=1 Tax=Variovorax sp. ZT4R33 TaxID=3443743 RepID=UPI003F488545
MSAYPQEEFQRLAAVRRYDVLDTPPDGVFDRVTAMAAALFSVPISIISLVDVDRIWFKSHHGLEVNQIGRDPGLCASAILQDGPWLLNDAKLDPRSIANPLVAGDFGLRFYLGIPLKTSDGFNLGTLCVIDKEAHTVSEEQIAQLEHLAALVMDQMELRLAARTAVGKLSSAVAEKEAALQRSELMAKEIEHRVMNSLQVVSSLLLLQSKSPVTDARSELARAAGRVAAVAKVHKHVSTGGNVASSKAGEYLCRLSADLSSILGVEVLSPVAEGTNLELATEDIISLGLIVNELVTNATKQGASKITVSLESDRSGSSVLIVSDNGNGLPTDFDPRAKNGLGMQVISSAVAKLGGEFGFANRERTGAVFTVRFHAPGLGSHFESERGSLP